MASKLKVTRLRIAAKIGWYAGKDGGEPHPPVIHDATDDGVCFDRPAPDDEIDAYWGGYGEGR